ncbi:MAG: HIT family protein [Cellulosilyticaceae bacterium]
MHILILPKIHVDSIEKVPLAVLNEMLVLAQKIVPVYHKIYSAKGYSIMQNGGEFCDFGHFHLHLFPRYSEDGFGWN